MTITEPNDAEISFDPNASSRPTAPPAEDVPVTSATAIPIVSATAVTESAQSSLLPDGSNIQRTTNADGSLTVKVTKTTPQPDGYRFVRIEEYEVPASMAQTVIESMDMTGEAPSSLYLTKIEDHRLPPGGSVGTAGGAAGILESGTTAYPTPGAISGGAITTPVQTYDSSSSQRKNLCIALWLCVIVVTLVASFAIRRSHSYTLNDDWNPSFPTINDDYFTSPSFPTINDDFYTSPIWSPTSFTLPPDIFKPFPPTSSPAPSSTTYPTWDFHSYDFTFPPALSHMFSPTVSQSHVDTTAGVSEKTNSMTLNRLGDGNEGKKKDVKITPTIISPTFVRDPTTSPSRREISDDSDGSGKLDIEMY